MTYLYTYPKKLLNQIQMEHLQKLPNQYQKELPQKFLKENETNIFREFFTELLSDVVKVNRITLFR